MSNWPESVTECVVGVVGEVETRELLVSCDKTTTIGLVSRRYPGGPYQV